LNKKAIIALLVNIPLTYIFFCVMGWLCYFMVNGNPTFFVPLRILLLVFFELYIGIIIGLLKYFKIYTFNIFLIAAVKTTIIYILLAVALKA
jgi:hypothetical protein